LFQDSTFREAFNKWFLRRKGTSVRKKFLLTLLLTLSVPALAAANVIYVDCNGLNDPGSGTIQDPFRRIQAGIDAASNGDTILIRLGVYTGTGNYNLDPQSKSISDPNDPNIVVQTIIDPNQQGRGFYLHSQEDSNCVISGLTIKNAYTADLGAGIYCYKSNPTIANCIFTDNHADMYSGGAICCKESNSLLVNCTINRNYAYDGGGIECWSGSPRLINCIISNNHAVRYGGGVDCYYTYNPNMSNCNFVNNRTGTGGAGGAICLWSSGVNLNNSILWANDANTGAQLYLHIKSSASVSFCDVQGGTSGIFHYSPSTVSWGSGNIDIDPCFASFDPNGDPNLWDFHLQSTSGRWNPNISEWVIDANFSQCIDAGDPNSDWTAEPWPNGKRINMGAYGGTAQASKSGNLADFDVNGVVNFPDLMEFCSKWLDEQGGIVNLNLSGRVDFRDFAIFAENWLWVR
jgi:hypothetical protein